VALRYLYRKIPTEKRICKGCGNPILRNIALLEGEMFHYGCLMKGEAEHYECLDCYSRIAGADVVKTAFEPGLPPIRCCPSCGSTNLKPIRR